MHSIYECNIIYAYDQILKYFYVSFKILTFNLFLNQDYVLICKKFLFEKKVFYSVNVYGERKFATQNSQ